MEGIRAAWRFRISHSAGIFLDTSLDNQLELFKWLGYGKEPEYSVLLHF